jgi:hypothetical protein
MIEPKPDESPDIYYLIRQAIERRQQVHAVYHGYYREMCPHAIGFNKHGEAQALFYQCGGESSQPLGPAGSPDNWRCLRLSELEDVSTKVGEWQTAPDHTRPNTCIFHRIDLAVSQ